MLSNDIPVNSWETKKKQKQRKTIKQKKSMEKSFRTVGGWNIYWEFFFPVMTHAVFVHVWNVYLCLGTFKCIYEEIDRGRNAH